MYESVDSQDKNPGFVEKWAFTGASTVTLFVSRRNGESLSAAIMWEVCHACNRPTNNTSVTLGAGSFPNASFDEIGIWLEPLETQTFVDIYNAYKGMYVWI